MEDAEFRLSCYALIRDNGGRILLLKRPSNKRFPNQWELPGGKLDPGESVSEAVAREANQETGLTVHPIQLVGAVDFPIKGFRAIMLVIAAAHETAQVAQIEEHIRKTKEHVDCQWVTPEVAMKMDLTDQLRRLLSDYIQRQGQGAATRRPQAEGGSDGD